MADITKIMITISYSDGRKVETELDPAVASALGGLTKDGAQIQPYLDDDDLRALEIAKLLAG